MSSIRLAGVLCFLLVLGSCSTPNHASILDAQSQAGRSTFSCTIPIPRAGTWVVWLRQHKLDRAELVLDSPPDGAALSLGSGGRLVPLESRPLPWRYPAWIISSQQAEVLAANLHIEARSEHPLQLRLSSVSDFSLEHSLLEFLMAVYLGSLGILTIWHLILWIRIRDANSLFYSLYIGAVFLYQIAVEGYGAMFIWRDLPFFMDHSYSFFTAASYFFGLLFTRSFLETRQRFPRLDRLLTILLVLVGLNGLACLFTIDPWVIKIGTPLILASTALILVLAWRSVARRYHASLIFAVSWTILLSGALVTTGARVLDLPWNPLTEYALHLANLLEAILLALAMGEKVRLLQQQQRRTEAELAETAYRMLQTRMEPHFLMNSINLVMENSRHNPDSAYSVLDCLAKTSAYLTRNVEERLVTIASEWDFVLSSLNIMKARWGDTIDLHTRLDPTLAPLPIPPYTLQPIVENALRHGVQALPHRMIDLTLQREKGRICLTCRDNGPGPGPDFDPRQSRTLNNIRRRLEQYYQDIDYTLVHDGHFTTATLSWKDPELSP